MAIFGKNKTTQAPAKAKAKPVEAPAESMKDLYSEAKPAKADKAKAKSAIVAGKVLVRPLVTEKATNLVAAGQYAFVVSPQANKIDVAKAVRAAYGVEPVAVNIISVKGKRVSRGRIQGQRKDWKKAIVTLAKGQTIKLYEGV